MYQEALDRSLRPLAASHARRHGFGVIARRAAAVVVALVLLAAVLLVVAPARAQNHDQAIRDLIESARGGSVPVRPGNPTIDREGPGSGNIPVLHWASQERARGRIDGGKLRSYLRNQGWDSITGSEFGGLYYMAWVGAGVLSVEHLYPEGARAWLRAYWSALALASVPAPDREVVTLYDKRKQRRHFDRRLGHYATGFQQYRGWAYSVIAGNRQIMPSDLAPWPYLTGRQLVGPLLSAALGKPYSAPTGNLYRPDGVAVFEWPLWIAQQHAAGGGDFGLDDDLRRTLARLVSTGATDAARAACEVLDGFPFGSRNAYMIAGGPGFRASAQRSTRARENKPGYGQAMFLDGVASWWSHGVYPGGNVDASPSYASWSLDARRLSWRLSGQAVRDVDEVHVPIDRVHWMIEWTDEGCEFADLTDDGGGGPQVGQPVPPPPSSPVDGVDWAEARRQTEAAIRNISRERKRRAVRRLEAALRAIGGG